MLIDIPNLNNEMALNPFTLSFDRRQNNIEAVFREDYCKNSLSHVRIVLSTAIIMYGIFGILDSILFPDTKNALLFIRYAVVCPLTAVILATTYLSGFYKYLQAAMVFCGLLCGTGILTMVAIAPAPGIYPYYAGVILTLMYVYTFAKIRFVYASAAGWSLIVLYEIVAVYLTHTPGTVLVSNNFFFISANIVGMFTCYSIELYARRDFYFKYLLSHEQEKTQQAKRELEKRVKDRTSELEASLKKQKIIQDQLIESEKLAALGTLVGGIAHEINTPVGIGITASSFLEFKLNTISKHVESGSYSDEELKKFILTATEGVSITLKNLQKAADVVRTFKQVAINRSEERQVTIRLQHHINEITLGLTHGYGKTKFPVRVRCPGDIIIKSYPDNFALIISNLIKNSFQHGFAGLEAGEILVDVTLSNKTLIIQVDDNGKGMNQETLSKIFNPFFTTRRIDGNIGLGMHIVHNIVTRVFGGTIQCKSTPGTGTLICISIPANIVHTDTLTRKKTA